MAKHLIVPHSRENQFTVFKDGKAITTGHKRHACQSFVHFNSIIGSARASEAELAYFDSLSDEELDDLYPVGTEINL